MTKPKTISEYITSAPKDAQKKLHEMRGILKKAAPKSTEAIKWGSPVFEESRILFAFNAIKGNISFMPTPRVMRAFAKDLKGYVTGKATIKFPLDKPLPKALITKIAKYRAKDVRENDVRWM